MKGYTQVRSWILVMLDLVRISAQIGENQLPCADSLVEIFLQYCLGEGSKKYSTLANRQTLAIERCPPHNAPFTANWSRKREWVYKTTTAK